MHLRGGMLSIQGNHTFVNTGKCYDVEHPSLVYPCQSICKVKVGIKTADCYLAIQVRGITFSAVCRKGSLSLSLSRVLSLRHKSILLITIKYWLCFYFHRVSGKTQIKSLNLSTMRILKRCSVDESDSSLSYQLSSKCL